MQSSQGGSSFTQLQQLDENPRLLDQEGLITPEVLSQNQSMAAFDNDPQAAAPFGSHIFSGPTQKPNIDEPEQSQSVYF